MDLAFRTPLVDVFRRGHVDRDVRLLAAGGALAPRAHEQVALLILLVDDSDTEVAATAERTLQHLPAAALSAFLARADVALDVREFFAARGIHPAAVPLDSSDGPLLEEQLLQGQPVVEDQPGREDQPSVEDEPPCEEGPDAAPERHAAPAALAGAAAPQPEEEGEVRKGTAQRLAMMTVAERMKVAMQGTREERGILIRDPNRLVSAAVLSSPKLTESEVEAISRMTNVSDEVLRTVGMTRAWVKNYNVLAALVRNAKTPVAISLTLLNRLSERDIRGLASDRNIPEPVRLGARKQLAHSQARRQ